MNNVRMRLDKRFVKYTLIPGLVLAVTIYVYISYFCSEETCGESHKTFDVSKYDRRFSNQSGRPPVSQDVENLRVLTGMSENGGDKENQGSKSFPVVDNVVKVAEFPRHLVERNFPFSFHDNQVLVNLHIQKTGGTTFGRHLVSDIVGSPCKKVQGTKVSECRNSKGNVWIISRGSTGWICGLHADWTVLTGCVGKAISQLENKVRYRRYYYITMLRDPELRFLSEWRHVQRGATWDKARLLCNGREASLAEVPFCYEGADWKGVSLWEFYSCKHNLAINRQVRMMANLTKVGCYDTSLMSTRRRESLLVESAINNLKDMAYFGLTEYQKESQYLFEQTFHLKFSPDFEQYDRTKAMKAYDGLSDDDLKGVRAVNALDNKLYSFAKELFFRRLKFAQERESRH